MILIICKDWHTFYEYVLTLDISIRAMFVYISNPAQMLSYDRSTLVLVINYVNEETEQELKRFKNVFVQR